MGFSYSDYLNMQARVKKPEPAAPDDAVTSERGLHLEIIKFCDAQWPRWKYIRSRMDKRSTIAVGSQDFTIFMPKKRTLCVECKRKGEKPTAEQQIWHKEMEMLGHEVKTIYSMEQFLEAIK